jgi:hypothetical protein
VESRHTMQVNLSSTEEGFSQVRLGSNEMFRVRVSGVKWGALEGHDEGQRWFSQNFVEHDDSADDKDASVGEE